MTRSGYAKGKHSGHVTQQRTLKPKPSHRKGVSCFVLGKYEGATDGEDTLLLC